MIEVFTDGGCSGNPGPGAWAFVILSDEGKISGTGGELMTTNNRMELSAVIFALKKIEELDLAPTGGFSLSTDSRYVQQGISQWIHNWLKNNWMTASKKPVKNKDLWVELKTMSEKFQVKWKWVAGHAGHQYNEECDSLVQMEMKKIQKQ